jgi:hypothetical protein
MAVTEFQHDLCRLIARNRIAQGEAYVAGGIALGAALHTARVSRDIDLFHDTHEALARTFAADLRLLQEYGYHVEVLQDRVGYAEAVVSKGEAHMALQWACDSAYRFFPLIENSDFGLTLHPFDLATNKVLALVGRAETRDWVDTIDCHRLLQPLGYLIWAACGKDPALSPAFILEEARRTGRYTQAELGELVFDGPTPNAAELACQWKRILTDAGRIHAILPPECAGCCVLGPDSELYAGDAESLSRDLAAGRVAFHAGRIGGVWPSLRVASDIKNNR